MTLKEALRSAATEAGFADLGFARATVLEQDAERLERWIAEGRHGEMTWFEDRPRRRATLAPWVRTVLVATTAYPLLAWEPGERKYASYAEGSDYHDTMKARLAPLAALLRGAGGRAKRLVDTGAILERAWAREAGLGFLGRNTMLIAAKGGPAVLIGIILTDLELPPDSPGTGTCGECVRCLEACPTGALDDQGLDARKCISYLTIELKRPLTEKEKVMAGSWEFGCDDCLTVCPYTKRGLPRVRPQRRGATRYGK